MSRSQAEKALIHEHIVEVAAKRFREVGLNGIGVADVMKEAGRTGGGFYKHFESRDKLVEEAMTCAYKKRKESAAKYINDPSLSLSDFVESYLSERHINNPGSGCAVSALMNDVARSSETVRALFSAEAESQIATMMTLLNDKKPSETRAQAILAICTLAGAVGLARAISDEDLSRELTTVGHTLLKALEA